MSGAWHALGIAERIVVSGSVVYRWAPTPRPFALHPTDASHPPLTPIPPETAKPRWKSCKLSYLLDSRVATAPPCAQKYRETSAGGLTARTTTPPLSLSLFISHPRD